MSMTAFIRPRSKARTRRAHEETRTDTGVGRRDAAADELQELRTEPGIQKDKGKEARKTETERMKIMIFLLAGIVGICGVIALAEGIVWIWEKMDPPTKIEEVRANEHRRAA